jgi:hypothetical protein
MPPRRVRAEAPDKKNADHQGMVGAFAGYLTSYCSCMYMSLCSGRAKQ